MRRTHDRVLPPVDSRGAGPNIAEGSGRKGRDRAHFFQIAHGSAVEASSQLMQLELLRLVSADDVGRGEELLDRVRAMLWRLIRSAAAEPGG